MKPYHTPNQWVQFITELAGCFADCVEATARAQRNKDNSEVKCLTDCVNATVRAQQNQNKTKTKQKQNKKDGEK